MNNKFKLWHFFILFVLVHNWCYLLCLNDINLITYPFRTNFITVFKRCRASITEIGSLGHPVLQLDSFLSNKEPNLLICNGLKVCTRRIFSILPILRDCTSRVFPFLVCWFLEIMRRTGSEQLVARFQCRVIFIKTFYVDREKVTCSVMCENMTHAGGAIISPHEKVKTLSPVSREGLAGGCLGCDGIISRLMSNLNFSIWCSN